MEIDIDLDKLEQVATQADKEDSAWPFHMHAYHKHMTPAVVLELVRRLRAAESKEAASHDMMIALAGLLETMQKAPPVDLVRRLSESHKECLAAYTKAYNAIAAQGASHD